MASKAMGAVTGLALGTVGGFVFARLSQTKYNDCYRDDACPIGTAMSDEQHRQVLACIQKEAQRCQDLHPVYYWMSGHSTKPFGYLPVALTGIAGAVLGGYVSSRV